jgi:hypothetical protein
MHQKLQNNWLKKGPHVSSLKYRSELINFTTVPYSSNNNQIVSRLLQRKRLLKTTFKIIPIRSAPAVLLISEPSSTRTEIPTSTRGTGSASQAIHSAEEQGKTSSQIKRRNLSSKKNSHLPHKVINRSWKETRWVISFQ